ncbi:MAG: hypothetical protein L3J79_08290, partial [Candidatus Marinimicrobia bacterium]|nr:hypothetical protein [Candidatus Neomarinimicrobiota bacterium]
MKRTNNVKAHILVRSDFTIKEGWVYDHTLLGEAENGAKKDFFNGKKSEEEVFSVQCSVFSGKEVVFECFKSELYAFNLNRFTGCSFFSHEGTKTRSMKESKL